MGCLTYLMFLLGPGSAIGLLHAMGLLADWEDRHQS